MLNNTLDYVTRRSPPPTMRPFPRRPLLRDVRVGLPALVCAAMLFAMPALGQDNIVAPQGELQETALEQVDPSAGLVEEPDEKAPAADGETSPATGAAPSITDSTDEPFDGTTYPVTRFTLDFLVVPPNAPSIDGLRKMKIELSRLPHADGSGDVWVPAERTDNPVAFDLDTLPEEGPFRFSPGALASVNRQIVTSLSREGLGSIIVAPDEADIGFTTGEDLRGEGDTELHLTIFLPTIREIQSFATGERIAEEEATNHPAHERVLANSPVKSGELFWPNLVNDYVARLNRHPGRRVVAQLSPSVDPQQLYLDYQITESKPWVAYASVLNTGSDATGNWQARVGLVHLQPTNRDDILSLDYVMNTNGNVRAVNAGYELPVLTDRLRVIIDGSYADFEAESDDAFPFIQDFKGRQIRAGLNVKFNVFQYQEYFVDLLGGFTWEDLETEISTEDKSTPTLEATVTEGDDDFLTARVGLGLERKTQKLKAEGQVWVDFETFSHDTSDEGDDETDFESLGRLEPDDDPIVLRWNSRISMYVDAMLADPNNPAPIHAHEVVLRYRGQSTFGKYRLIPYHQQVAGGVETVRGYEQGATAGDSVHLASFEYRFHVPRVFEPRPPTVELPVVGEFAYAPRGLGERPDWDWVLKGFYDVASIRQSDKKTTEFNDVIQGVGVGTELFFKRNLQLRFDWGIALEDAHCDDDLTPRCEIEQGDWDINFSGSVFY